MQAERHSAGFTLLELLVAFAIMAAALGVLGGIFGDGLRAERSVEARLALVRAAENRLADFGTVSPLIPGTSQGSDGALSWTVEIAAVGAPTSALLRLYRVRVQVSDGDGRIFSLATRRLGR